MWKREVVEKVSLTSHFVYLVVLKFCCCWGFFLLSYLLVFPALVLFVLLSEMAYQCKSLVCKFTAALDSSHCGKS